MCVCVSKYLCVCTRVCACVHVCACFCISVSVFLIRVIRSVYCWINSGPLHVKSMISHCQIHWYQLSIWSWGTHFSVSSLQLESSRREERCFTPESPALLPLSPRSLMCEGFDLSADARELKPSSVILQFDRLQREKDNIIVKNKCRDFSALLILM